MPGTQSSKYPLLGDASVHGGLVPLTRSTAMLLESHAGGDVATTRLAPLFWISALDKSVRVKVPAPRKSRVEQEARGDDNGQQEDDDNEAAEEEEEEEEEVEEEEEEGQDHQPRQPADELNSTDDENVESDGEQTRRPNSAQRELSYYIEVSIIDFYGFPRLLLRNNRDSPGPIFASAHTSDLRHAVLPGGQITLRASDCVFIHSLKFVFVLDPILRRSEIAAAFHLRWNPDKDPHPGWFVVSPSGYSELPVDGSAAPALTTIRQPPSIAHNTTDEAGRIVALAIKSSCSFRVAPVAEQHISPSACHVALDDPSSDIRVLLMNRVGRTQPTREFVLCAGDAVAIDGFDNLFVVVCDVERAFLLCREGSEGEKETPDPGEEVLLQAEDTRRGIGMKPDAKAGAALYNQSAALGNLTAAAYVRSEGYDGRPEVDASEALAMFERAIPQTKGKTRTASEFFIGWHNDTGTGIAPNPDAVLHYYRGAAEKGHVQALHNLGLYFERGQKRVPMDQHEAVRLYHNAAVRGSPLAQTNVGFCFANGRGTELDHELAVEFYRKAADIMHPQALCNLGFAYANGTGVQKDEAEAVRCYQLAADEGNSQALCNLGFAYAQGSGVAADPVTALRYYRKAAEAGNTLALNNLGYCYAEGHGVEKDEAEAVRLYRLGAENGNSRARCNLGASLAKEHSNIRNDTEAIEVLESLIEDESGPAAPPFLRTAHSLVETCRYRAAELVRIIVEEGIDAFFAQVDLGASLKYAEDKDGNNPLHVAAFFDNLDFVERISKTPEFDALMSKANCDGKKPSDLLGENAPPKIRSLFHSNRTRLACVVWCWEQSREHELTKAIESTDHGFSLGMVPNGVWQVHLKPHVIVQKKRVVHERPKKEKIPSLADEEP